MQRVENWKKSEEAIRNVALHSSPSRPLLHQCSVGPIVKRIFSSKHLRLGKKQNQQVCKAAWGSTDHTRYIMSSSYQYLTDSIVPGVDLSNFFLILHIV